MTYPDPDTMDPDTGSGHQAPAHVSDPGAEARLPTRRAQVLALRVTGLSYRRIGERLGVSHDTVARDLAAALSELQQTNAAEAQALRELELCRLDKMSRVAWRLTRKDDPGLQLFALDRLLRISERRCKLLGLDAARDSTVAVDVTVTTRGAVVAGFTIEEKAELLQRLKRGEDPPELAGPRQPALSSGGRS